MNLAEAFTILATSGCRLVPDPEAGLSLVVPDGRAIPGEVLEVMRAHREQLVAAHAAPVPEAPSPALADDLADYLRDRGLARSSVELVTYAAKLFRVHGQSITIESVVDGAATELFEPGIPIAMKIATEWRTPGVGSFTVPAGTEGLLIPQIWAIADHASRLQVEATMASEKRRGLSGLVVVWLAGEPRVVPMEAITTEGLSVREGVDRTPWVSQGAAA